MKKRDSLIVFSGGMDSTTLLYEYRERIAWAVTFDYGSKHNASEILFARYHCEKLGIRYLVIPLEFMNDYFKSSLLLSGDEIPEGHYAAENIQRTVVPFRNGIMLSVAAGLAESYGLSTVMIANHAGDHVIYPDCRPEFIAAMNEAVRSGTSNGVQILAPYTNLTKTDIARHGKALGVDYARTWSCYKGGDVHCGRCGTCIERREALRDAGIPDPTEYLS